MKDYIMSAIRSLICALCAAAFGALSIALMLALYDIPRTADIALLHWSGTLLVLSFILEALSRRGVSALAYLAVCCAVLFFGGEQTAANTVFTPASSGFPVFLRICIWASGGVCAWACQKEPDSNVFVRLSDVLIVYAGIYMATLHGLNEAMIMPVLGFALASLLLCMLVTAALRAGGESDSVIRGTGMGGYLVIGALLLVCLGLAALLLTLSSGHVDGIVDAFLAVWRAVSGAVMQAFTAFILFMSGLFGPPRAIARRPAAQQDSLAYSGGAMEEMGAAPQWVVYLVMGVIAALIIAAILAILWALRGTKLGRTGKKKSRRKVTRTSRMGEAIRALIARAAGAITFELRYRANRHTPQGLYVYAVRTCRLKMLPKHKSESAGAYIRRLHQILLAQTGLSTLDRLADMLDRALYSGTKPRLGRGESDAFAAQLRAIAAPSLIKTQKSE